MLDGRVTLHRGDCRDVIAELADASIDSIVTDPPYALVSIQKRFGKEGSAAPMDGVYRRATAGFMGKQWDTGETAFAVEFWQQALRVLKPGGHVLAFAGTRTYHRLAVAIEDAGFEIRDMVSWLYGSGFPKSHNQPGGWGTALKPACEPIVLARKPLVGTVAANVLAHGTGALNIDGCRIEGVKPQVTQGVNMNATSFNVAKERRLSGDPNEGRWPANVIHDGSDEVVGAFPATASGGAPTTGNRNGGVYGEYGERSLTNHGASEGSAARFFYSAKADAMDRVGSKHPTVKPVDLMRYLCRLVTPPGGVVLDPFAGTGTTGEAAFLEGFRAILVEREAEYQADIERRMSLVLAGPEEAAREIMKARGKAQGHDDLPLFSEAAE